MNRRELTRGRQSPNEYRIAGLEWINVVNLTLWASVEIRTGVLDPQNSCGICCSLHPALVLQDGEEGPVEDTKKEVLHMGDSTRRQRRAEGGQAHSRRWTVCNVVSYS